MKYRLSPRVALLTIAALFFLPLVLAWLMYSGTIEFRPHSTRNLGQLVHPPMPLTWSGVYPDGSTDGPLAGTFEGHWLILHAVPQPCGEDCLRDIADLRQVHRAAGRQQSRIRLALLHDPKAAMRLVYCRKSTAHSSCCETPMDHSGSPWNAWQARASLPRLHGAAPI